MSAIVELLLEVGELRKQVKSMKKVNDIQSNSMARGRVDNTHRVVPITVDPLMALDGKLNGLEVRVLKDDGCHANVVSKRLVKRLDIVLWLFTMMC